MVGHFVEVLAEEDRVGQLAEHVSFGMLLLDAGDEVVKTDGIVPTTRTVFIGAPSVVPVSI